MKSWLQEFCYHKFCFHAFNILKIRRTSTFSCELFFYIANGMAIKLGVLQNSIISATSHMSSHTVKLRKINLKSSLYYLKIHWILVKFLLYNQVKTSQLFWKCVSIILNNLTSKRKRGQWNFEETMVLLSEDTSSLE